MAGMFRRFSFYCPLRPAPAPAAHRLPARPARRRGASLALVLLSALAPHAAALAPQAQGDWHGWLLWEGRTVGVGLTVQGEQARLSLPDQGIRAAVVDTRWPGASAPALPDGTPGLGWRLEHWPGHPQFQGRWTGSGWSGTFSQGQTRTPLTLRRGPLPAPERPQEPRQRPYREEAVRLRASDGTLLAGTLTLPAGRGPVPGVLLLSGSGPQDRDSTLAGHRPFLVLADALARAGYASLRLDDRGVGGSGGDLYRTPYAQLQRDAVTALTFLRRHPRIDARRTGLLGHSEGSSVALAAAQQLSPAPRFLVLLAGPAVAGRDLLSLQRRAELTAQGRSPREIEEQVTLQQQLLYLTAGGRTSDAAVTAQINQIPLGFSVRIGSEDYQRALDTAQTFGRSVYLQDFLAYDPAPDLRRVRQPVLAVYGRLDVQVPPPAGAAAARAALGRSGEVHELPGLNHLLQPARTGLPSEYADIPTTLAPAALQLVTDWLGRQH